jgi:sialate O-acetylesterase
MNPILRALLILILPATAIAAEPSTRPVLKLPFVFSDNMVLQRDMPDPIWGSAPAGDAVNVSFAGQTKSATADDRGKWTMRLDPMPASNDGRDLTVTSGRDMVTFHNVVVGEVWLCGGQSNMEKPIGEQKGQRPTENAKEEIAAADHPLIRLLAVPKVRDAGKIDCHWEVCTPATIDSLHFSAVGYFFGRKIQQEMGVPVGLIHSNWGGTRIEPWTNVQGFDSVSSLKPFADALHAPGPTTRVSGSVPAELYKPMIRPMIPFAIRGVLWYQGESNVMVHDRGLYFDKMLALITGWRAAWGEGDFPFYYVQLAPYLYSQRPKENSTPEDLPYVWEAQTRAMSIPHTGMVVITDLVDKLSDIHPIQKREVGERLAAWALAHDYGKTDVVFSGPMFKSLEIQGNKAIVHFDDTAGGLASRDGKPLSDFTIAGADGKFADATATIDGDTVDVTNPDVPEPKAVRLGWDERAMPNLENKAGLPAGPFRTDRD